MTDIREFMTGWFEPGKPHMTAWSKRQKEGLRGTATGKRYVPGFRPFDMLSEPNQSLVIFENSDQRIGVEYVTGTRPNFVRNIDFDELFFQFSGRSVVETEFGVYETKPGELLHIPAGIAHRSSGTADCARLFARLNEPLTHMHKPEEHVSHVEYEVVRHGGPQWANRQIAIDPPKGGEVIEKMICWRDTPEYYTTVRRSYDVLVGASSLERDAVKSGIRKIRVFDFFTEITGRRGPGPKIAEFEAFRRRGLQHQGRAVRLPPRVAQRGIRPAVPRQRGQHVGVRRTPQDDAGRPCAHTARHRAQRHLRGGFPAHRALQPVAVGGEGRSDQSRVQQHLRRQDHRRSGARLVGEGRRVIGAAFRFISAAARAPSWRADAFWRLA